MYDLAPLIYDLALMLGIASVVALLFQRIRQPVVLGYLVAGMIVGPHTPPHELVSDIENIQILSELGVIFLMFSIGLEFSFQKLMRVGLPAVMTGIIEVILMLILGYWIAINIGWSHNDALFLGAALSISSTTIIIKAIDELGLKNKRFAELIFGILIVEDLVAILLLVALSTVAYTQNVFSFNLIASAMRLLLFVSGWFLSGYFLIVPFFRLIASYVSQETLTIVSVALCLLLVCVAASLHFSTPLGAFIMGSILAETPLIHRIEDLIRPIRDIFAAVFFISVGMLIDPSMIIYFWKIVLLLSVVTIIGKIITTSFGAVLAGQSFDRALRTGFGMAQIGEFSFIIIALGMSLEAINSQLYPIIVAVSVVTTFTTPYLIRVASHLSQKLDERLPSRVKFAQQAYGAFIFKLQSVGSNKTWFGSVIMRVVFNGILIAIIFSLMHFFVFHRFAVMSEHSVVANVLLLLLTLALSSPFLWGMLFAYRVMSKQHIANTYFKIAVSIIWLTTFVEVFILGIVYFNARVSVSVFVIMTVIFILAFRHLEKLYRWFEFNLLSNISHVQDPQIIFKELAPWDMHLIEIELKPDSKLVNNRLIDLDSHLFHKINVVAICREDAIIFPHCADVMIHPYDKLIVFGLDEDVEKFKHAVQYNPEQNPIGKYLTRFTLTPYLINKRNFLINKTIHEANAMNLLTGKIVGLDRGGRRIFNPDYSIRLHAYDLLLIVNVIS